MYAFFMQWYDTLKNGNLHYFIVFFVVVWLRWLIIQLYALTYRPYTSKHRTSTAVIIPVVDEDPQLFKKVLWSVCRQRPSEVIVVINGPANKQLKDVSNRYKLVKCYHTPKPGKRGAIQLGLTKVTSDTTILVDSDTIWQKGLLREIIKPFKDTKVGGVTSKQQILNANKNTLTRFCNWMEEYRATGSFRAMSSRGSVGCLPGRTIAFRTSILHKHISEFMTETFMGFHKEVSDDRSLTNLTLRDGYKTVYQSTAVVKTEAPEQWRKFIRQQLRWAEGSQYNNLKMAWWMARHARLTLFIYATDMLIPFFLVGVYLTFFITSLLGYQNTLLITNNVLTTGLLVLLGAWFSMALRQLKHFSNRPSDSFYLLPYLFILTFIMTPIRIVGFSKLADDLGWGTRRNAYTQASKKPLISYLKTGAEHV